MSTSLDLTLAPSPSRTRDPSIKTPWAWMRRPSAPAATTSPPTGPLEVGLDRIDLMPPERLDAALIFAPVGALVPAALAATRKGGAVVCGGIHMSDIPAFPYRLLWEERVVRSVANLTRRDA